jgi:hypothetical protein
LGTTGIYAQWGPLDLGASGSFTIKKVLIIWASQLNALWCPWFGIAGLRWGCWDAVGGSYDGSDEHRASRKGALG